MNAMLDIDIQAPDLRGQLEPILGELEQLRKSNALLKKCHTEIEAYGLNLQHNLSGSRGFDRDFLNLENLGPSKLVKTGDLGSAHGICLSIRDAQSRLQLSSWNLPRVVPRAQGLRQSAFYPPS
jgi:hypothetical protein